MRLTIEQAVRKGYKDVYFTWHGLGDNIVMFFAAETYFKTKGKKLLISTNLPDLLDNSDYCDFIDNINTSDFSERYKILQKAGITPHFLSCTRLKWLNENENVILWPDCHIAASYCSQLGISGKIDIQPRLYFSDEEKSFGRFFEKKQIAIMTDGMQNYKTYPFEKLQKIVNELKNDYNFVQIGKKSDQKLKNCLDKRGAFTIRQVAAVLHNSDCFVGGIGGLMHLAKASGCPAVITYSKGEPFYCGTYPENINVVARKCCDLCGRNLRDPQHQRCLNNYSCIRSIKTADVVAAIRRMMSQRREAGPFVVEIKGNERKGLEHYWAQFKTLYCDGAFVRNNVKKYYISLLGLPLFKCIISERKRKFFFLNILLCVITQDDLYN